MLPQAPVLLHKAGQQREAPPQARRRPRALHHDAQRLHPDASEHPPAHGCLWRLLPPLSGRLPLAWIGWRRGGLQAPGCLLEPRPGLRPLLWLQSPTPPQCQQSRFLGRSRLAAPLSQLEHLRASRLMTRSICHLARERESPCSSDHLAQGRELKTMSQAARTSVSALSSRGCLLAFLRALARARSAAAASSGQALSLPLKRCPSCSKMTGRLGVPGPASLSQAPPSQFSP